MLTEDNKMSRMEFCHGAAETLRVQVVVDDTKPDHYLKMLIPD
jgi:hypothetical protein